MFKRLRILFSSWYYMALNIIYFLFLKKWVDKKIKEYLSRTYTSDDIIVVGVHGIFEYYWQSLVRYMIYFDKHGKVFIPIAYDFFRPHQESLKVVAEQIESIKKKTGARIILVGNSSGATIVSKYLFKIKGQGIEEFISLAIAYLETSKGVAFWWKWLKRTPKEEIREFEKILKTTKVPKMKVAIYAKYDAFLQKEIRQLKPIENIGFETGHFGMLYSMEVIKYFYNYIFKK